jgi:hypothetical protein
MSAYLARLKQLENGQNSRFGPNTEPSKPSEVPFEPFEGVSPAHSEKKIADDPEVIERSGGVTDPPDPGAEARRQRVLTMLRDNPGTFYAALTDDTSDPDAVILTLAIRGRASCELLIPRDRYDGVLLLDLIEKHSGTVH